jgi:cytochrome P450
VQKSQVYGSFKYFFSNVDMSMTTINKKEHAFKRRINIKALRPQAIEAVQDQILQNIRYFCCTLVDEGKYAEWSASRNMSKVVGYLISDIMGDITSSKN